MWKNILFLGIGYILGRKQGTDKMDTLLQSNIIEDTVDQIDFDDTKSPLEDVPYKKLRIMAKDRNIEKYYKMNKKALIQHLS